jgi:cation diffusion facilitator family transporter
MQNIKRYQQARQVTLYGIGANLLLTILKIIIGIIGHSQALFADGIHSFSDLITDALVIMAAKAGSHAPDQKHPYGHGRIETVMSGVLALILIVVAGGIVWDAVHYILQPSMLKPAVYGLFVALVSILINEWLFRYTLRVGKQISSNLLLVNAWHHRSDVLSSVIVLIGMGGSILGIHYLDSIAAIIVAVLIFKMGLQMAWQSLQELIDTAVSQEILQQIQKSISKVEGVLSVHQVRTRLLGGFIYIEVHVLVDPHISVSEGHFIANQVMRTVQLDNPKIVDVLVHVDPEEDEIVVNGFALPDREELQQILKQHWLNLPGYNKLQNITLHYLRGKVEVELFLPLGTLKNAEEAQALRKKYQNIVAEVESIASVAVWFA